MTQRQTSTARTAAPRDGASRAHAAPGAHAAARATRARPAPRAAVEALPPRTMLSVTPAVAAWLEGAGYQRVTWAGRDVYAEPGEWIVSMRGVRGPAVRQVAEAAARLRKVDPALRVLGHLGTDGLFKVGAPASVGGDALRARLARLRQFEFAEPNAAVWAQGAFDQRSDPFYSSQYSLENRGTGGGSVDSDIDGPEAWAAMAGAAQDVVVGVIDTGVDYTHPDLASRMWVNPFETPGNDRDDDGNGYVDDVYGADFAAGDGDPMDEHSHGTHVAGIIAAEANNGVGVSGVAPNARIMALRFLGTDGLGELDNAVKALNYAADMKRRGVDVCVTNNSWGGADSSAALSRAVRDSGQSGMLFVAAAGNGGSDEVGDDNDVTPFYPASYEATNILAVAAADSRDALARLSNYGPNTVHLAAPGMLLVSTFPDGGYGYLSGTSMAAPHVAGVAAMAFGMHPGVAWEAVKDAVMAGADKLASMAGKTVTGGRLNAMGALWAMQSTTVVGRHVFYNDSAFDGRDAAAGAADDAAIAPDKVALRPGQAARFEHYTSYSRGINGVMVDLRSPSGDVGESDFEFAVRTAAGEWVAAPAPSSVSTRPGAGVGGSDRVSVTWADAAVRGTWLRVTVRPGGGTGLAYPDVFYFGNAVADTGNSATDAAVNAVDFTATRAELRSGAAPVDSRYDFNRDGLVNSLDLWIVRRQQLATPLALLRPPSVTAPLPAPEPVAPPSVSPTSVFSAAATPITPERIQARRRGALLDFE